MLVDCRSGLVLAFLRGLDVLGLHGVSVRTSESEYKYKHDMYMFWGSGHVPFSIGVLPGRSRRSVRD